MKPREILLPARSFIDVYRYFRQNFKKFTRRYSPILFLAYCRGRKQRNELFDRGEIANIDLYRYYEFIFHWKSPDWLRKHRFFFTQEKRGFGEAPFHAAWRDVLTHFRPTNALEIGVYRGQVISLWQLVAKDINLDLNVFGLSPLEDLGDSVSKYRKINYEEDIKANFKQFLLKPPKLIKAASTEVIAREFIQSKKWDLIYIDGSHDFETVLQDYREAVCNLNRGGILCMDDSSLYLDITVDGIFKGHSGPSRVVLDFAFKELRHFMTVGHNNFFVKT